MVPTSNIFSALSAFTFLPDISSRMLDSLRDLISSFTRSPASDLAATIQSYSGAVAHTSEGGSSQLLDSQIITPPPAFFNSFHPNMRGPIVKFGLDLERTASSPPTYYQPSVDYPPLYQLGVLSATQPTRPSEISNEQWKFRTYRILGIPILLLPVRAMLYERTRDEQGLARVWKTRILPLGLVLTIAGFIGLAFRLAKIGSSADGYPGRDVLT